MGGPYVVVGRGGGQAVLALCGLGYLTALGLASFTLLLSAKMRSTMPVAVIPMTITFLGLLCLFITPLMKIVAFTPPVGLDYAFHRMVSYGARSLVADLPTLLVLFYGVLFMVLTPFAMRAYMRHQVA